MKKYIIIFSAMLVFICGTFSAHAQRPMFDDSTLIVVMKPQVRVSTFSLCAEDDYSLLFSEFNISDIKRLDMPSAPKGGISLFSMDEAESEAFELTLAEPSEQNVIDMVDALNELDEVDYAQPNYLYYLDEDIEYTPNDTSYSSQYALPKIGAQYVWARKIDCSGVVVAVIDSGIKTDHEDLADNIWINDGEIPDDGIDNDGNGKFDDYYGWNFIENDGVAEDSFGHGTHVAGIISAATNNGKGIASLSCNAKLMPVRALNQKTVNGEKVAEGGTTSIITSSIKYAASSGADIINLSLGSEPGKATDTYLKNVIASYPDVLFVAASGNNANNNDVKAVYPASHTVNFGNVISVAATTAADALRATSNYGCAHVDLAAPGDKIFSTYKDGVSSYQEMSGTSMACPLVVSAAAVLKARYPDLTPYEIKTALTKSVDKSSMLNGKVRSGGRLNAYKALQYFDPTPSPTPAVTPSPTPSFTPTATPTITPTPSPTPSSTPTVIPIQTVTPTPTPMNSIVFGKSGSGEVIGRIILDMEIGTEDLMLFAVRKEDNIVSGVVSIEVSEDMTFILPEGFFEVYVWDRNMCPLMDIQTFVKGAA